MDKKIINYNIKTHDIRPSHARVNLPTPRSVENIVRHAEVSEKAIERYLVEQTKLIGLPCLKYSNPNMVGYPDRIVILPEGAVLWVELKSKDHKPSKIQSLRFEELRRMGHIVRVIDSRQGIDELIEDIKSL